MQKVLLPTTAILTVSLMACSSGSSSTSGGLPCQGVVCQPGEACFEGACRRLCESHSDCGESDLACNGSFCVSCEPTTWYRDADGDTFGTAEDTRESCIQPDGYVEESGDCNDRDKTLSPETQWFEDKDGDEHGNAAVAQVQCTQPRGYVMDAGDCNDGDEDIHIDAEEVCDGKNNDCQGDVDDGFDVGTPCEADCGAGVVECAGPQSTRCSTAPGGSDYDPSDREICDGQDNDCDGAVDNGAALGTAGGQDLVCAAPSCRAIRDANPQPESGVYWIEPEGGQAFQAYCEMEVAGGGWMLVWKNTGDPNLDGTRNNEAIFSEPPSTEPVQPVHIEPGSARHGPAWNHAWAQPHQQWLKRSHLYLDGERIHNQYFRTLTRNVSMADVFAATDKCTPMPPNEEEPSVMHLWANGVYAGMTNTILVRTRSFGLANIYNDNDTDDRCEQSEAFLIHEPFYFRLRRKDRETIDFGLTTQSGLNSVRHLFSYKHGATDLIDHSRCNYDCWPSDNKGYHDAFTWYVRDIPADEVIAISAGANGVRQWADGSRAESCWAYRYPRSPMYRYEGNVGDGAYSIQPPGADEPYTAYCDMTTNGGGWTLVATLSDADADRWSQFSDQQDTKLWKTIDTFNFDANTFDEDNFQRDYKSQAFIDVPATSLLIKEDRKNVLVTNDCWPRQSLRAYLDGLEWEATASENWPADPTRVCPFEHFGYSDPVLRASTHAESNAEIIFKWGEKDGVQDDNKDRTMITTKRANGQGDGNVSRPTGLGGFADRDSDGISREDCNECQGDAPANCTKSDENYQLFVR